MGGTNDGTIKFADGSTHRIEWVYPDAPACEWVIEREHWPEPLTPMDLWIWHNGTPGADRSWDELGLVPPEPFYRFQTAGPFLFFRATPPPPERLAVLAPPIIAVTQKYGGAYRLWKDFCEERIIQACDDIAKLHSPADMRTAAETLFYGFYQTFTCLSLLFIPTMQLNAMLQEHGVGDPELTAYELTQGGDNATQDIDAEVWRLAELARALPSVVAALGRDGDASLENLRRDPAAAPFVTEFDAMIARHSRRSQGWMLTLETWGERPEAALSLVRAQIATERVSPDELRERSAAAREAAMERALAAIPAARHGELRDVLNQLEGYVDIREGRAYWQLVITGAMRGFLLRVGEGLVKDGRVDRADDVFFLTPEELTGGSDDLRGQAAAARAEWDRWRTIEPPPYIGTVGDETAAAEKRREEFRGSPASRGTVTARVRILQSPEDGTKLQRGEILVSVMTTPAWTPLFAIAGGIITETGGALSHPAITAREYGIPAVVALPDATRKLKDGQIVTIDGAAGTVSLD
jgi:phosphohistidine swiveling domain-containing protein